MPAAARIVEVAVSFEDAPCVPGGYHRGDEDCAALVEADGCEACIEEMDDVSDVLLRRYEDSGVPVLDVMLLGIPDGFGGERGDEQEWRFVLWLGRRRRR